MKVLLATFLSFYIVTAWGEITPSVVTSVDFDTSNFIEKKLSESTPVDYTQQIDSCNNITFKQYSPSLYKSKYKETDVPDKVPVDAWYCLFSVDVYGRGYSSVRLGEDIYFDKNASLWKVAKNKFDSQNELSQALEFYNIKTLEDAYPIELYNITSVNAQGYAIIDKNISSYDVSNGIKGNKISFCLIHKYYALCGNGGLVKTIDGVDVDFTPYILKSLETVRVGVNAEDR